MKKPRLLSTVLAAVICLGLVALVPTASAETSTSTWSAWTPRTAPEASGWEAVAHGNGTFVAVAKTGTTRVMSSEDGITWTARTAPAGEWTGVTFANGKFVAVSQGGGTSLMTSDDGITWTAPTLPSFALPPSFYGVAYGGDKFVVVGVNAAMTSPDGVTWTKQTIPNGIWIDLAFGGNAFVAIARTGTNRMVSSPDGATWTAVTVPTLSWDYLTYGGGKFLAFATMTTDALLTSSDGTTWTTTSIAEQTVPSEVTYANNLFFMFTGLSVKTSSDGTTWTARSGADASVSSMVYAENLYVAVANQGTNRIVTTADPLADPPPTTTSTSSTIASATTVPASTPKPLKIPTVNGPNARIIAKRVGVPVPAGAKARTRVAPESKKICRISEKGNLLSIKSGTCTIFLTVTPLEGKPLITRHSFEID